MDDQHLPVAASAAKSGLAKRGPMILEGSTIASLRGFIDQPAVRRSLPAIGMVGVASVAIATWFALQTPTQVPLFQGLGDADKAAIAEALTANGTDFTLDPTTGTIGVDEDRLHEARMVLAGQGLPKSVPSGDAVLAAMPMGSSRAVEAETLRGARETDLARTIDAIDAIKSTRVHIADAEPSAFVRDRVTPQASVMVTLHAGRTLSQAQVRAVRHLVASSVAGMSADNVSVVDQSGTLLSQQDAGADDPALRMQTQVEDRYRTALATLLGPIVGRDSFTAEVNAQIDLSESQATRETYPKEDRALTQEEGNRSGNSLTPAIGIPGALSNQPPPPATLETTPPPGAAPTAPTTQTAETYSRRFDVGREISVTHRPRGAVARLTVAVALRELPGAKKRSADEIAAIEALVKGAVGFNAERGDVVTVSSRPFAAVTTPEVPIWDRAWFMPVVRQVGALIALVMILIVGGRIVSKGLKARPPQDEPNPSIAVDPSLARMPDVTLEMIERTPGYAARAELVRGYVQQHPERAATVVRGLLREPADG